MRGRIARLSLLLGTPLLLQGCVAAVIPAIAASGIVKSQASKGERARKRQLATSTARPAKAGPTATLLPLKALPPPTQVSEPTMRFVNYALTVAARGTTPAHSMVLSPASRVDKADFLPCAAGQPLAVAIDAALADAPMMVEGLRRLRAFSIEPLWIADTGEVDTLRATLTKSGAWTHGDAPILTTGVGAERKELVRQEATRAFCVVAVAGGRRADVEELYAYLRDPIVAAPLESYWDAGWFVLPPAGMGN
jgi:hypothetical protein